jgi:hypothetical protein
MKDSDLELIFVFLNEHNSTLTGHFGNFKIWSDNTELEIVIDNTLYQLKTPSDFKTVMKNHNELIDIEHDKINISIEELLKTLKEKQI